MDYQVVLTRQALRDLEQIREFIAKDKPSVAAGFCEAHLDKGESLSTIPERGGQIVERPGARFVVLRPYLILYRIDEARRSVSVLRFWHGARDRKILQGR